MLTVQRLREDEGDRLRPLRLAALKDAPDAFETTYATAVTWPAESWAQQLCTLPTFVAVLDGVDSGIVRQAPHSEQPAVAYLLSLWVAPSARGRGVGNALIKTVVNAVRSQNYRLLLLDVAVTNAPAIALYQRHGFRPTGVASHLPPPREHIHELEMGLDLSSQT